MFNTWDGLEGISSPPVSLPAGSGSEYGGSNAGPGGTPGPDTLYYQCQPDYVAKYRAKFGVAPAFCGREIPPEATGTIYPETQTRPIPRYILPPPAGGPDGFMTPTIPAPPTIPTPVTVVDVPRVVPPLVPQVPSATEMPGFLAPTPKARLYPSRRMPRPAPQLPAGELCPPVGYVTRPIPGAHEYGVFPCHRGQPVVIDPARMASMIAAAKRRGLSDLDGTFDFVKQELVGLPVWAWLGIAAAIFFVIRRRR